MRLTDHTDNVTSTRPWSTKKNKRSAPRLKTLGSSSSWMNPARSQAALRVSRFAHIRHHAALNMRASASPTDTQRRPVKASSTGRPPTGYSSSQYQLTSSCLRRFSSKPCRRDSVMNVLNSCLTASVAPRFVEPYPTRPTSSKMAANSCSSLCLSTLSETSTTTFFSPVPIIAASLLYSRAARPKAKGYDRIN